jgi:hypothetical protein
MADQIPISMLAVAFFLMGFIYLSLSVYCCTRLYRVFKYHTPLFLARTFYISMLAACVAYLLAMTVFLLVVGQDQSVPLEADKMGF